MPMFRAQAAQAGGAEAVPIAAGQIEIRAVATVTTLLNKITRRMLPADYTRAPRLLARRDPVIAALIRTHGTCGLARAQHADPFHALVQAIISQQLSTGRGANDRPADARRCTTAA